MGIGTRRAATLLNQHRVVMLLERDLKILRKYSEYAQEYSKKDDQSTAEFWRRAVGGIVVDIIGADNIRIADEAKL